MSDITGRNKTKAIPLDDIRLDGGTQVRATINMAIAHEYGDCMKAGDTFPPVILFFDDTTYWLVDGFHRFYGARHAGRDKIGAEIRAGTQRDAILFSVGVNAQHGLYRSNDDKRQAVLVLLNDSEWSTWSNNKIADAAGVSDMLVAEVRNDRQAKQPQSQLQDSCSWTPALQPTLRIGKDGKRRKVTPKSPQLAEADSIPPGTVPLLDAQKAFRKLNPAEQQEFMEWATEIVGIK